MPTSFPTGLDALSNPAPTDDVNNATAALKHSNQHANVNDAVEALQVEVGVTGSAVTTSLRYLINRVKETVTRDVTNARVYLLNYTTDHFIVGSNQLDDAGGTDRDKRLWFNKTKGAFRAGEVTGTQWNDASVGLRSVAFGLNNIASGEDSIALGGNATASGVHSFAFSEGVASGSQCAAFGGTASADRSFSMGTGSIASGHTAVAMGNAVEATGSWASARGYGGVASGAGSSVDGCGAVASRFSQYALSGIWVTSKGEAQASRFVARRSTTSDTPLVLLFDNGAFTANTATLTGIYTNVLTIPASRAHRFTINAIARRTDTQGDFASWKIEGTLVRSSTGNARFISTPTVTADKDAGASGWNLAVSVDTSNATNNYLAVTATGQAGATIRWVAEIATAEVG